MPTPDDEEPAVPADDDEPDDEPDRCRICGTVECVHQYEEY